MKAVYTYTHMHTDLQATCLRAIMTRCAEFNSVSVHV